jgi:23S rRNA pseudouridine1911/1915/1917 synthase
VKSKPLHFKSERSYASVYDFLKGRIQGINEHQLDNLFHKGRVLVANQAANAKDPLEAGQEITVHLNPPQTIEAEKLPLNIVYEDLFLMVIEKQAGMAMHPGLGNFSGTLLNALKYHHKSKNDNTSLISEALVHRLDKDTSGLLVIAKTRGAMKKLEAQFQDGSIERRYHALVWGTPSPPKGRIDLAMGRHPVNEKLILVCTDGSFGKQAITDYEVEAHYGPFSLMALYPQTGRTHQLRVHLHHIGHGIAGDERYVQEGVTNPADWPRLALHASLLGFIHPMNGKKMHFESPLPTDLTQALKSLKS